jgi:hypothetical protein
MALNKTRVANSLKGMLVGDALAVRKIQYQHIMHGSYDHIQYGCQEAKPQTYLFRLLAPFIATRSLVLLSSKDEE